MRFEIVLNGERQFIAGTDEFGVLSAILTRVKRNPAHIGEDSVMHEDEDSLKEQVTFNVTGIDLNDTGPYKKCHFHYPSYTPEPGDEIVIRILEPGEFDPPEYMGVKDHT
ncbi:MAG: hypothetical protein AAF542_08430 [Pseudomonadota bacterium]